jgi:Zn-dependent protease
MAEAEVYYNPEQQTQNKKDFSIKKSELIHILIAWIGITFAFSWKGVGGIQNMLFMLPIIFAGTLTGFIGHELAHKFAAIHYNMHARFFLWPMGLGFAIVLSLITSGGFVFAAPGAVYIWGQNITKKQNGIISFVGPASNYIIALISLIIGIIIKYTIGINYLMYLFFGIATINLFLGGFNLLPIPPLDGFKIFIWNKYIWIISLLVFIGTYILLLYI